MAGLMVPLALSFAVCVQLAGRVLSLWRLGAAVTSSQVLFHTLFVLGSSEMTLTSAEHEHHGHAHHVSDITVVVGHAAGHGDHGSLAMTLAHIGGAAVTTLALHHAEWLLSRGADLATWLGSIFLLPLGVASHHGPPFRATVIPARTPARVLDDIACGVHTLRGPPRIT